MITLNGQHAELRAGETLAVVLARLGVSPEARGVAVAVDDEVVPRRGVGVLSSCPSTRAWRSSPRLQGG